MVHLLISAGHHGDEETSCPRSIAVCVVMHRVRVATCMAEMRAWQCLPENALKSQKWPLWGPEKCFQTAFVAENRNFPKTFQRGISQAYSDNVMASSTLTSWRHALAILWHRVSKKLSKLVLVALPFPQKKEEVGCEALCSRIC